MRNSIETTPIPINIIKFILLCLSYNANTPQRSDEPKAAEDMFQAMVNNHYLHMQVTPDMVCTIYNHI